MKSVILASTSPRRKKLFAKLGIKFKAVKTHYAENMNKKMHPHKLARYLSEGKAQSIASKYHNAIIVAADTFIVFKGTLLGKPRTTSEAKRMLQLMQGKMHFVITGFTILDTKTGKTISDSVKTKVWIKKLSGKEIEAYVKTKEPLDKAGAYAIQGQGAAIIEKIKGDYDTIVGLPLSAVARQLEKFRVRTRLKN